MKDLQLEQNGSVDLIRPLTEKGRDWLETNVHYQGDWVDGGAALAIEPRYTVDILKEAYEDGLGLNI